jgi:hypothetical protein
LEESGVGLIGMFALRVQRLSLQKGITRRFGKQLIREPPSVRYKLIDPAHNAASGTQVS